MPPVGEPIRSHTCQRKACAAKQRRHLPKLHIGSQSSAREKEAIQVIMPYEIDCIPVGEGERGGDVIAIRCGVLGGPQKQQTVIVIDGGAKESGEALVEHIKTYYGSDVVNLARSTHPDQAHASGLCVLLESPKVGGLLMHKPWEHTQEIKKMFKDGRITASGLQEKIEKSLQTASDLEAIAKRKNIPIYEPFEGMTVGTVFRPIHELRSVRIPCSSSRRLGGLRCPGGCCGATRGGRDPKVA